MLCHIQSILAGNIHILVGQNIGHSKRNSIRTCVLFGTVSKMELFHCTDTKLLLNSNYVLFLITVFIVQVATLVEFNQYNTSSKITPPTVMHFAASVMAWRVGRLNAY